MVGHFSAGVIGTHDGAQAGCGADGGKACHAGTGNEHLGGRHLAGGRDLAIEETAKRVGGFNHGAVAAHTCHGGQRIHLLGTTQCTGQRVNRQHGSVASG